MAALRLFIALETPAAVREALCRTIAELKNVDAEVRWESEEKLHGTLKFLGDTPEARVEAVLAGLERTASATEMLNRAIKPMRMSARSTRKAPMSPRARIKVALIHQPRCPPPPPARATSRGSSAK